MDPPDLDALFDRSRARRLEKAVEDYLTALDGGQKPDRAAFLARYPDLAVPLERALNGLDLFDAAASQVRASAAGTLGGARSADDSGSCDQPLGDYVLRREIGRGGMGVVYEAEQLSLRRPVALKVLPFAAALDAVSLQRFRMEAHVAACLHHAHIVPVHGVGCERGVHFYVMQLIPGQSLAEIVRARRGPRNKQPPSSASTVEMGKAEVTAMTGAKDRGPEPLHAPEGGSTWHRCVAIWGVQAATALAYAHEQGVIHRDVKPGNLLIDAEQKLWVTDFGLARATDESTPTLTGDIVGTLRYMSPEQALGQRERVDGRADVYSLGATLHELLTSQPPFDGRDRQELLHRITTEEPRPLSLRDPTVPVDLDTIVRKALAKEPADRYASARLLAEDLQRFLDDRAILARPPTGFQRLRRWSRRHRTPLRAAAVTLLLGVLITLTATAGWIWRAYQGELAQRELAEEREKLAQDREQKVLQAVLDINRFAERVLVHMPGKHEELREFTLKAVELTTPLADGPVATPEIRAAAARAYWRLGDVENRSGQHEAAEAAFREALRRQEELSQAFPENDTYCYGLGTYRRNVASYLNRRNREAAIALYRQAIDELEQAVAAAPKNVERRLRLNYTRADLAETMVQPGRYEEVIAVYEAIQITNEDLAREYPTHSASHQRLAMTAQSLGKYLGKASRLDEAEAAYRKAILHDIDLAQLPDAAANRHETRSIRGELGKLLLIRGKTVEAERYLREGIRDFEDSLEKFPHMKDVQGMLALRLYDLGHLYHLTNRSAQARASYQRALQLLDERPRSAPLVHEYSRWLCTCPVAEFRNGKKALSLLHDLIGAREPNDEERCNLGLATFRIGNYEVASEHLQKPFDRAEPWLEAYRLAFLAMSQAALGQRDLALERKRQAEEWVRTHPGMDVAVRIVLEELSRLLEARVLTR